jgi:transcriptional regulator with XRE-family HTH domain
MQFHEKLKSCRLAEGWTQEQLAERVCVSRVTVSKWETGRGFPNLGSLQQLASLFRLSIDELLSTSELVAIARSEVEHTTEESQTLMFGLLDFVVGLLLALPLFFDGKAISASLVDFVPGAFFQQAILVGVVVTIALFGVAELALQHRLFQVWSRRMHGISLLLSLMLLVLFVSCRQPYHCMYVLGLLVAKVLFLLKRR